MKECIAVLLLVLIAAGVTWNLLYLENMTDMLLDMTDTITLAVNLGSWDEAVVLSEKLDQIWAEADFYTHIFIRHPEIDGVTDAICSLRGAVAGHDRAGSASSLFTLEKHLTSILGMEKITLGSIF